MKNKSNLKTTGVLLVLIFMLLLGLIYINNINSNESIGARELKSLTVMGQLEAQDKTSSLCSVDELMAEASGAVVKLRNLKGETLWSKTLVGKVANMKSAASSLYILDSSNQLYCLSKNGKLNWERQLEGDVKNIYTERNGDVLIVYTEKEGIEIQIINGKGVEEGDMSMENADVIAFASGKEENALSIIDLSTETLKTKIITLNLKGDMLWSDNFDNQIMPMLGYTKENALIVLGEETVYKYQDKTKKQSSVELNKAIHSASISQEGAAVIVRSKSGYEAITLDSNLKEQGRLELKQRPNGIILDNNHYILYYSERLILVDLKGKMIAEYRSIQEINKAYFGGENSIIAVSDRLIKKLEYK